MAYGYDAMRVEYNRNRNLLVSLDSRTVLKLSRDFPGILGGYGYGIFGMYNGIWGSFDFLSPTEATK